MFPPSSFRSQYFYMVLCRPRFIQLCAFTHLNPGPLRFIPAPYSVTLAPRLPGSRFPPILFKLLLSLWRRCAFSPHCPKSYPTCFFFSVTGNPLPFPNSAVPYVLWIDLSSLWAAPLPCPRAGLLVSLWSLLFL